PDDGFDANDDMEDYLAASISPTSGATPLDGRRGAATPVLDQYTGYERPQAHTEDSNGSALSQWRNNVPSLPSGPRMPVSRMITMSYASELGYITGSHSRTPLWRPA